MLADIYRAGAERGISSETLDRTLLWKIGAMFRPAKSAQDESADAFAEYAAWRAGDGPEPEARPVDMAQVVSLTDRIRRGT